MPASTGLGGSSAFAVGLLNALHAYKGERVAAGQLAEEACHIEIKILQEPIGKQDQYSAAYGGFNVLRFRRGGNVTVEPVRLSNGGLSSLFRQMLLFWTGHQRDASVVLSEQKQNTADKMELLLAMRGQALELQKLFYDGTCSLEAFGRILEVGWQFKRELARAISNEQIDRWYNLGRTAGALGGKLCGAGGGGFLLFIAPTESHGRIRKALAELRDVTVDSEVHGSQILMSE